jgi:hypothetical protein
MTSSPHRGEDVEAGYERGREIRDKSVDRVRPFRLVPWTAADPVAFKRSPTLAVAARETSAVPRANANRLHRF